MEKIKLAKPIKIDGKEVKEIEYDLEAVTVQEYKNIIQRMAKQGIVVAAAELDPNFQQEYFAKAAQLPATELNRLHIRDFMKITGEVRNFLLENSAALDQIPE